MNEMGRMMIFILMCLCFTACHGQKETGSNELLGHPKVVKPFGTHPYTNIRCSIQDRKGNLWFGTTGAGVYRYDGKIFTNFTQKDGLSHDVVYCILEDKAGNIWFGTKDGVCRFDEKKRPSGKAGFIRLPLPEIDDDHNYFVSLKNDAPVRYAFDRKSVFSMAEDKAGNIWMGTGNAGLFRFDGVNFINYKNYNGTWEVANKDSVNRGHCFYHILIQSVAADRKGNVWFSALGDQSGVYRYDGKAIARFSFDKPIKSLVSWIKEDKAGNMCFGSRDEGVCRYDGKTFTYFTSKNGLCSNFTTDMLEDKSGNLWFSSSLLENEGRTKGCVTRFDGKTFKQVSLEGLGNTSVWTMLEDKKGYVWLGARNVGLYRYDGKSFTDFTGETAR
ncbi:hypothetical protein GVN16_07250 [Emticicia sp. CRIBPO]|uniref:ligand-binding sensor domain-containing protein n=1 Tax=Emticicia sp. CRIBPO TaxID=2683258 RepID=UPI001411D5C5|nr:two-component regulator propeller domain-containing protein [Emticicia sp. CRIBPO]NBA85550.1 hypothetical protein [Emticicia sp. CRIBPO]